MTGSEALTYAGIATAVIAAIASGLVNIIIAWKTGTRVQEVQAQVSTELAFNRKRGYEIKDAVEQTQQAVKVVHKAANEAFEEANNRNAKIQALNEELMRQGELAKKAAEVIPAIKEVTAETNALVKSKLKE